jgi:hypothetical protein
LISTKVMRCEIVYCEFGVWTYMKPQLVQHWRWPIRLQSSFVFS